jgi:hypothetical protein
MYVMAEAYRFASTGDKDAQQRGLEAFAALEFLNKVTGNSSATAQFRFSLLLLLLLLWKVYDETHTGIKGYPARSVVHLLPIGVGGQWWSSPTEPGWLFKGNTSSDESELFELLKFC